MEQRFADRTVVAFGAGSVGEGWGNGKAAAVQYAREGAFVVAVDLNPEAARKTREIIASEGHEAVDMMCDVTQRSDIDRVIAETMALRGRIDVLHNNVGLPIMGSLEDTTEAQWDLAFAVNLKSVYYACQAVVPLMKRTGRGAIVNIASVAAIRYTGYPYPSYYASKAALVHFTTTMAVELAPFGIRANAILPGMMDTPHIYKIVASAHADREKMVAERNRQVPMLRMGTGWDVAKAAAFLASDDAGYITGQALAVDGGISNRIGG